MIYSQKGNTCFAFAAANAQEKVVGKAPSKSSVYRFFKECGFDPKKGVPTPRTFFNKWMEVPLSGVRLKSYKPLWMLVGFKYRLSPLSLLNRLGKGNFIVTVRTPIKLDKDGYMLPPEDKRGDTHMCCVDRVEGRDIILENSWGKDWGESGYFKMRIKDVWSSCLDIWEVSFE